LRSWIGSSEWLATQISKFNSEVAAETETVPKQLFQTCFPERNTVLRTKQMLLLLLLNREKQVSNLSDHNNRHLKV
jgi:hypothetical protein